MLTEGDICVWCGRDFKGYPPQGIMLQRMQQVGTAQACRVSCPPHQSMCRHHAAAGRRGRTTTKRRVRKGRWVKRSCFRPSSQDRSDLTTHPIFRIEASKVLQKICHIARRPHARSYPSPSFSSHLTLHCMYRNRVPTSNTTVDS